MAVLKLYKEVSSLPATLEADAAYIVRVGKGFDLYVTDTTGTVAYTNNSVEIEDNLTSTSIKTALSSNQGRILSEQIGNIDKVLEAIV